MGGLAGRAWSAERCSRGFDRTDGSGPRCGSRRATSVARRRPRSSPGPGACRFGREGGGAAPGPELGDSGGSLVLQVGRARVDRRTRATRGDRDRPGRRGEVSRPGLASDVACPGSQGAPGAGDRPRPPLGVSTCRASGRGGRVVDLAAAHRVVGCHLWRRAAGRRLGRSPMAGRADGAMSGLLFLPDARGDSTSARSTGVQRVRRRRKRLSLFHTLATQADGNNYGQGSR